jgi:hypothetical protein
VLLLVNGLVPRLAAAPPPSPPPPRRGLGLALQRKRSLLEPRLQALGFDVLPAQGTYFLVADVRWAAGWGRQAWDGLGAWGLGDLGHGAWGSCCWPRSCDAARAGGAPPSPPPSLPLPAPRRP